MIPRKTYKENRFQNPEGSSSVGILWAYGRMPMTKLAKNVFSTT